MLPEIQDQLQDYRYITEDSFCLFIQWKTLFLNLKKSFSEGHINLVSVCFNRNKQMMGLGSLFGEGDLQHLDGDAVKEKQVVDKQVTALWEIL